MFESVPYGMDLVDVASRSRDIREIYIMILWTRFNCALYGNPFRLVCSTFCTYIYSLPLLLIIRKYIYFVHFDDIVEFTADAHYERNCCFRMVVI